MTFFQLFYAPLKTSTLSLCSPLSPSNQSEAESTVPAAGASMKKVRVCCRPRVSILVRSSVSAPRHAALSRAHNLRHKIISRIRVQALCACCGIRALARNGLSPFAVRRSILSSPGKQRVTGLLHARIRLCRQVHLSGPCP